MAYSKTEKTNFDDSDIGRDLIRKAEKAFNTNERRNIATTWALLAEFILPTANAAFFGNNESKGVRKDSRVFDSTAIQSNRDLASAMHATITNPAMQWSKLRFKNESLNDVEQLGYWLQDTTNRIHSTLNDSNFDSQIGKDYQCGSALGTMVLFHEDIEENGQFAGWNFEAWHLAEIAYCENALGLVDTIYRKRKITIKQAYEKFGEAIGEDNMKLMERNPLDEIEYYHCIYPREMKDVKLNEIGLAVPKDRPFASCYVLCKGAKLVKEDGYYEFPVYVSRWSTLPGEIYGYGPGHVALSDVRTLNKLRCESLKALAKMVNPPIITTKQNILSSDFGPGKLVPVRDINQMKEFITQTRFDAVKLETEDLKGSIKSAFYIDKLLLPPRTETGEMTAYEIAQRLEQMQTILGPVLSKMNSEFLTPFIVRCYKSLLRANKLEPLPQEVLPILQQLGKSGEIADFEVMFVNSLARSQQMSELRNVQAFLQEAGMLAQMDPSILDDINKDEVVYYMAKIRNIPEKLVNTSDQVQQIRQQRAQEMQHQQMLQTGGAVSDMIKNVGGVVNGANKV